jgi:hypothetical protein
MNSALGAASIESVYSGVGAGQWRNAGNWTNSDLSAAYPDNNNPGGHNYHAKVLADHSHVTLDGIVAVDSLTMQSGNGPMSLTLTNNAHLTAGGASFTSLTSAVAAPSVALQANSIMNVAGHLQTQGPISVGASASLSAQSLTHDTLLPSTINGTLSVQQLLTIDGGALTVAGSTTAASTQINPFGVVTVPTGGQLAGTDIAIVGLLDLAGGAVSATNPLQLSGALQGHGSISSADVSGGINPGSFASRGHIDITGDLTFTDSSFSYLSIDIADRANTLDFDTLATSGDVELATYLTVVLAGTFVADPADEYIVLTAASIDAGQMMFDTLGDGRIVVYNDDGEAGTFAYELRAPAAGVEQLVLRDFRAIPEPGLLAPVALVLGALVQRVKKTHGPSRRG